MSNEPKSTYNKYRDLWLEFTVEVQLDHLPMKVPMCGLCGNRGTIDTRGRAMSPNGNVDCGAKFFCICPNGRVARRFARGSKYGKSSDCSKLDT